MLSSTNKSLLHNKEKEDECSLDIENSLCHNKIFLR